MSPGLETLSLTVTRLNLCATSGYASVFIATKYDAARSFSSLITAEPSSRLAHVASFGCSLIGDLPR